MKQEEKDLLLKDICGRLPYNVVINCKNEDSNYNCYLTTDIIKVLQCNKEYYEYKPYLIPIPSMTEEQCEELYYISEIRISFTIDRLIEVYKNTIEWFLKNHIDYNNLIGKDLAIDATNLNIY